MKQLQFTKESFQEKTSILGFLSVVCLGLSIPVSTSLTTIFTILAGVFWLASGKVKETYKSFKNNPVIRASILLFTLFAIGIIYSSAGMHDAFSSLSTYRKLFLIVIYSSFISKKHHQQWAIYAFFLGCLILLATSCVSAWQIFPTFSLSGGTITSRVTHSLFMAFFAFWLVISFMEKRRFKAVYGILFCLVLYNIFFVVNGRSGYVIFLLLMLFLFHHYLKGIKFIIGLVMMVLLISVIFFQAHKFSDRLLATMNNLQSYQKIGNNNSSIGQRLDFAKTSFILFTKSPLWGYGTGSFTQEYGKLSKQLGTYKTDNPHNEYLSIAVQLGIMGVILFVYLLAIQWKYSKTLEYETILAQGFVITMAVGSLMNSMLLDSGEGHFFAFFTAIIFANVRCCKLHN